MAVRVTTRDDGYEIVAFIKRKLDPAENSGLIKKAIQEIAQAYAEEWLVDNIDAIYKELDVKAISNVILLEVAKQVKNNIIESNKGD